MTNANIVIDMAEKEGISQYRPRISEKNAVYRADPIYLSFRFHLYSSTDGDEEPGLLPMVDLYT